MWNWLLYGYGVPIAAFVTAALLFRRSGSDRIADALEAAAITSWTPGLDSGLQDPRRHLWNQLKVEGKDYMEALSTRLLAKTQERSIF